MGWFGPQTGARDGAKEYKQQSKVPRGKTNSHWKAEEKNDKAAIRRADAAEKREAKKEAKRLKREAEGKSSSFFW